MSQQQRAGCFFTGDGGGSIGGISKQKIQYFQPSVFSPVRQ